MKETQLQSLTQIREFIATWPTNTGHRHPAAPCIGHDQPSVLQAQLSRVIRHAIKGAGLLFTHFPRVGNQIAKSDTAVRCDLAVRQPTRLNLLNDERTAADTLLNAPFIRSATIPSALRHRFDAVFRSQAKRLPLMLVGTQPHKAALRDRPARGQALRS